MNNEELKEKELMSGIEALTHLIAPYSEKTQQLVCSLIKPGDAHSVYEQFYNIMGLGEPEALVQDENGNYVNTEYIEDFSDI